MIAQLTRDVAAGDTGGMADLYHGTVREDLDTVEPASTHGGPRTFVYTADGDPAYAYATSDLDDAWRYAEKAWHASGAGIPRVYLVEPFGEVEPDPQEDAQGRQRGNYEHDLRSRAGFNVIDEMPWPERFGDPEDWR